jgi:hypothetical protein
VVSEHIRSFIETQNYIFPQLLFEIGVVNMVLDNFYGFIEDQVEILSPEEKIARNNIIIADVAPTEAKKRLEEWHGNTTHTLSNLHLQRSYVVAVLKNRSLLNAQIDNMLAEKKKNRRQCCEIGSNKKLMYQIRKKSQQEEKGFTKNPKGKYISVSEIENLLLQYNILAAAYHGAKLNCVDCREFVRLA